MGTATFASETVVGEAGVVKIADDVPFEVAAFLGCAVPTGVGAALRSAAVQPGDDVLVIGLGAVGLNAVMGAIIAGAATVIGIDPMAPRRALACSVGASEAISPEELAAFVAGRALGFDVAIDAVGAPTTIRTAWDAVRRGGTVTVVGAGRPADVVPFSGYELFHDDKRLTGSFYGGMDVHRDLALLISLWRTGRLPLDRVLSGSADLSHINDVVAAQRGGEVVRTVLTP